MGALSTINMFIERHSFLLTNKHPSFPRPCPIFMESIFCIFTLHILFMNVFTFESSVIDLKTTDTLNWFLFEFGLIATVVLYKCTVCQTIFIIISGNALS